MMKQIWEKLSHRGKATVVFAAAALGLYLTLLTCASINKHPQILSSPDETPARANGPVMRP